MSFLIEKFQARISYIQIILSIALSYSRKLSSNWIAVSKISGEQINHIINYYMSFHIEVFIMKWMPYVPDRIKEIKKKKKKVIRSHSEFKVFRNKIYLYNFIL